MREPSVKVCAASVEARLADAGRVLLALPWAGCFPLGFRTLWPDGDDGVTPRRPTPSSREISAMDEAYRWIVFIKDPDERRLVLMRSLVLPPSSFGTPRFVWTWSRLRRTTGLHPDTLKARWGRGIDRIVRALNAPAPRVDSGCWTGHSGRALLSTVDPAHARLAGALPVVPWVPVPVGRTAVPAAGHAAQR